MPARPAHAARRQTMLALLTVTSPLRRTPPPRSGGRRSPPTRRTPRPWCGRRPRIRPRSSPCSPASRCRQTCAETPASTNGMDHVFAVMCCTDPKRRARRASAANRVGGAEGGEGASFRRRLLQVHLEELFQGRNRRERLTRAAGAGGPGGRLLARLAMGRQLRHKACPRRAFGGAIPKGCGRSSGVEHHVANVRVVSSNLIARSSSPPDIDSTECRSLGGPRRPLGSAPR